MKIEKGRFYRFHEADMDPTLGVKAYTGVKGKLASITGIAIKQTITNEGKVETFYLNKNSFWKFIYRNIRVANLDNSDASYEKMKRLYEKSHDKTTSFYQENALIKHALKAHVFSHLEKDYASLENYDTTLDTVVEKFLEAQKPSLLWKIKNAEDKTVGYLLGACHLSITGKDIETNIEIVKALAKTDKVAFEILFYKLATNFKIQYLLSKQIQMQPINIKTDHLNKVKDREWATNLDGGSPETHKIHKGYELQIKKALKKTKKKMPFLALETPNDQANSIYNLLEYISFSLCLFRK